jgi:hypothetical protein
MNLVVRLHLHNLWSGLPPILPSDLLPSAVAVLLRMVLDLQRRVEALENRPAGGAHGGNGHGGSSAAAAGGASDDKKRKKCHQCGETGHLIGNCKQAKQLLSEGKKLRVPCIKCGGFDHFQKDCPK